MVTIFVSMLKLLRQEFSFWGIFFIRREKKGGKVVEGLRISMHQSRECSAKQNVAIREKSEIMRTLFMQLS